ncbi:type III pantothenate kinase [Hymenobacter sp. BT186]|uniref:Type III pantothenate kinase n=1 Tax=Hymenobacter telluris TaxID=2816474 RepID=A0A939EYB3_9BACT|nr:type III pantothenate kinase [Hymenobacter telluris]MBO0359745.1 type III pantothenate kinase [Hymenobacter telluris]MBW3375772.1 type III pantothenate kinase [Hymenobacter norwichensis]
MRTLALDIGNTAVKYGCFEDSELLEADSVNTPDELLAVVRRLKLQHAIVASVIVATDAWLVALQLAVPGLVLEFKAATTPLPIQNTYATPHTLGADRLAAAVGAAWQRPNQDTLIVDAGTAIKCDLVEGGHTFRGGSIAPGLRLRFQALHTFTGRLPLVELPANLEATIPLTGDSTQTAIQSGVLNGAAAEVNGLIDRYREQFPELGVVLAGGDAAFFQPRLKGPIFAIPELVLLGLHRILAYNVEL